MEQYKAISIIIKTEVKFVKRGKRKKRKKKKMRRSGGGEGVGGQKGNRHFHLDSGIRLPSSSNLKANFMLIFC